MRELYDPDDLSVGLDNLDFGGTIVGLGDVDGDGFDDIAISAFDEGSVTADRHVAPTVRVYAGSPVGASIDPTWTFPSSLNVHLSDAFGVVVSGIDR
jgi:hypothetical protein